MKKYLHRFIHEDDGTELSEWAIGIAIVAVLCGAVLVLVQTAKVKIDDANSLIGQIDPTIVTSGSGSGGGGGGSGGGGTPGVGG